MTRACSLLVALSSLLVSGVACSQQSPEAPKSPWTGRPLMQMAPATAPVAVPSDQAVPQGSPFKALNTGTGITFPGFASTPRYIADVPTDLSGAYVILEGEFNGKAGVDIAAVQGDGRINLLMNDGKGHFTPVYGPAPTYINASSGDVADLNGDGLSDIIVTNSSAATVGVYLNQGGQFGTPVLLTTTRPAGVLGSQIIGTARIGDVNNDGKLDIVFPVSYTNFSTNKTTLVVFTYLGDGHGNFSAPVTTTYALSSSVYVTGLQLADMAHSGKLGVVMQTLYTNSSNSYFAVGLLLANGNGDGTFSGFNSPGPPITGSTYSRNAITVRDYDGDGNLDVLFPDGVNSLELATGKGDGTLNAYKVALTDVGAATSVVTGDFNHDGILDVVTIRAGLALSFTGTGGGAFNYTPSGQYVGGLSGVQPNSAVDFDGDGNPDFVWVEPFYNQAGIFLGNGDSTFRGTPAITSANTGVTPPDQSERSTDFSVIMAGKYASKSRSDMLFDLGGYIGYGTLSGTAGAVQMSTAFAAPQLSDVDFVEPLRVDLNGDGYDDVVMATLTGVKVSLSNGDGTFAPITRTTLPVQLGCVLGFGGAGDLNGDGKVDMVFGYTGNAFCYTSGTSPSGYAVLLGDGKGGFTSTTFVPYGTASGSVRLADVNGDGVLDLVVLDVGYPNYKVTVLKGLGDGTFDTTHPYTVYSSSQYAMADVKALDMDGDGKVDLVMTYYGPYGKQAVVLAKGNGDFTFAQPATIVTGATGQYLEIADFNGDGLPDVAITLSSTSTRTLHDIAVIMNTGNDTFAAPYIVVMPTDPSSDINKNLFAGDYNGDGAVDLISGNGNFKVPSALFLSTAGSLWTLSSQPSAPTQGDPVQLIAQGTALGSAVTGSVQFYANGTSLGTATVANNVATLTTSALPAGTDVVSAQYSGDATRFGTAIAPVTLQVAQITPSFTITGSPILIAVTRGQAGSMNLILTSNASFQGTIALTCDNLPANTTCAFSPSSVTLAQSAMVTSTMTLTTSGSASLEKGTITGTERGILFAGLLVVPFLYRRKKLFATVLSSMLLFAVIGCGGSSANQTPRGTSFVTVRATATTSTGSQVTQTLSVPLTVN